MSMDTQSVLGDRIIQALNIANPTEKCLRVREIFKSLPSCIDLGDFGLIPDVPGREDNPQLIPPGQVPRRKITSGSKGRFALLHALSHIELNAVNLALDIAVRFGGRFGGDFVRDWLSVSDDEAKHFLLLQARLHALDGNYGDLPAHDGLWMSARATQGSHLARLAVVPMVLEARGLDVTPTMIEKLGSVGDDDSVAALKIIYEDEIGHVAIGRKWFEYACESQDLDPETTWQEQVKEFFKGTVKRPFNEPARTAAGMTPAYYEPLADWYEAMGF